MLELTALAALKGERLLYRGVHARIEPGSLIQIAGDNGTGKTTLLRQIAGLSQPTHGDIFWEGTSIQRARSNYNERLVYLGHLPGIKDDLNPEENLEVNARLAHDDFDAGFARETLIRLGLERQLMLPAMRLSAGQRRRVTLARLWLTKKPLWILDEPFTALDPGAVGELSQRIESHLDHGGICLYTTHQTVNIRSVRGRTLRLQDCEAIWA